MTRRKGLLRVILWCHGASCTKGGRDTDMRWRRKIDEQIMMLPADFSFDNGNL